MRFKEPAVRQAAQARGSGTAEKQNRRGWPRTPGRHAEEDAFPGIPACPQKLSGFVRSRCPFARTTKLIFVIRVASVSDVPVRNHKNTSLKAGSVPARKFLAAHERSTARSRRREEADSCPPRGPSASSRRRLRRLSVIRASPRVVAANSPSEELTRGPAASAGNFRFLGPKGVVCWSHEPHDASP